MYCHFSIPGWYKRHLLPYTSYDKTFIYYQSFSYIHFKLQSHKRCITISYQITYVKPQWSILYRHFDRKLHCLHNTDQKIIYCWTLIYNHRTNKRSAMGDYKCVLHEQLVKWQPFYIKSNNVQGGSPGLVVMGDDSFYEGHEFESQHHILDGLLKKSKTINRSGQGLLCSG